MNACTRPNPSVLRRVVMLGAGLGMLALLVFVGRWLTFWRDEWSFILERPDPTIAAFLAPHVDHLSAVPVLIYQVLLRGFGMSSYWPYLAVLWICHFATVILLYRIVARSAGPWIATLAALSLLTLGCAFEDLLQAFQLSFLVSTAFGLLAIDRLYPGRTGRARDTAIASVALVIAVGSSSVGVILLGIVVAWGVIGRYRQPVLAAGPAALAYGIWFLTWRQVGSSGPTQAPSSDPLAWVSQFVYGLGATVSGVIGLPPYRFASIGAILGAGATVLLVVKGYRPTALAGAALLGLLAMYVLQAVLRSGFGAEFGARSAYLYPGAIFLWLAVADGLVGRRIPVVKWDLRAVLSVALVFAIAGNLAQFVGAARGMRDLRATMMAELQLVERARAVDGLAMDRSPDVDYFPQITPRLYLAAIDRFGAPGLAVPRAPDGALVNVDSAHLNAAALELLADGFETSGTPASGPPVDLVVDVGLARPEGPGCVIATGSGSLVARWTVGAGEGFSVRPGTGTRADVRLGVEPIGLAPVTGSIAEKVSAGGAVLPPGLPDGAPWYASVEADGPVTICRIAPTEARQAWRPSIRRGGCGPNGASGYPYDRGQNYSILLGERVARRVLEG